jgi:CHAT domain-containing protein/Tfp pilus assembly protein PilF
MKSYFTWKRVGLLIVMLLSISFPSSTIAAPPNQGEDLKAKADALYEEGILLYNQADYQEAINRFEEALIIYQSIRDRANEGAALNHLGLVYRGLDEYPRALEYYQQALVIAKEIGYRSAEGSIMSSIGAIHNRLDQYPQALEYYQEALAIAREIGDREGEQVRLANIGTVYYKLGQYSQALEHYQQALVISQEIGDRDGENTILSNMGGIYLSQGQYLQALEYFQKALAIAREIDDRAGEGASLSNIGTVYNSLGQYPQALEYLQQALAIEQEIGNQAEKGSILNNIGTVYYSLGEYPQALEYYQQALAIEQEIGDRSGEENTLNNIGANYSSLGQYMEALEYFQRSLAIAKDIQDLHGEGLSLANMGEVYRNLSQYTQALEYYQQGLAIAQEMGDRPEEANRLGNIGAVYEQLGQYEQALDYFQRVLAIAREIGDQVEEGRTLNNIGTVYYSLGEYPQALEYYQQALAILQEIGSQAGEWTTLNNIGEVYRNWGQYAQALEYFQQALRIARKIGDRSGETTPLDNIGSLYEEWGDSAQAIAYYQQAIEVYESIQTEIRVEDLKTSFVAGRINTYKRLIPLLWKERHYQEAFNYAERARARAFLDGLAGGAKDFRADASSELLRQEQELLGEIGALRNQLATLHNGSEGDMDAIAAVQGELARSEANYAQLLTEIKLQSPEIASLVSVDVISLTDLQSLLDANTTLVEYFITEERTLVFLISHDTFETVVIDVSQDDLTQTITTFRDFANLDNPHPPSLKQLYGWLIAPLKDKLKTPVLGIIPHGVLHYLPFAALTDGTRFLSDDYTLFILPSASVLRFIQEKRKPESNTVLALGNPTTDLPSLQFAGQEAESIAKLYRAEALVGTTATESSVWDRAGNTGILHLAAHGEYNPYNPLFSAIHLTRDARNDGRLEVHEVYGLDLTVATNLVVLSACETNVGAVSAGDEVVGLNRAFIYAGTPTVISSLWNVDDAATALLMERFYTHLRSSKSKGEALRQAQMAVRVKYPHPYYWASFVLTGDPGPVGKTQSILPFSMNSWTLWAGGIGSSLLCIVVGGFSVLFAARSAEKRRLRKQLDMLLEDRQRWMSQPDSPMRARVLRQISHKLREIGRKEKPR